MDVTAEAVTAALDRRSGPGHGVHALRRLTGGASNETWSFDAIAPDGSRAGRILRRDRRGSLGASADTEAALLEAAARARVPVPAVCFVLDDADELGSGYVMERVEGETIPRRILRDDAFEAARPVMARQAGAIAARIHAVPLDDLPPLPGATDERHPAEAQIEQYRDLLDAFGEPHPVFEFALRWLADHLPPARPKALVHGDFRNGNFVVGPDGIRAVLDWELAHVGDPMEDLGWLCQRSWRFRNVDRRVGGFGDDHDLFAGYEEVSGEPVDPDVVRYWEVFGTLKWGEMCMVQAFTHLHGMQRSVELAAIGRRVAETEYHLMRLLEE